MKPRTKAETFEPVTMGHLRGHGVTRLLVYCGAINCNHHTVMNADRMTDDTAIRPLGDRMVCSRCGHRALTCGRIGINTWGSAASAAHRR